MARSLILIVATILWGMTIALADKVIEDIEQDTEEFVEDVKEEAEKVKEALEEEDSEKAERWVGGAVHHLKTPGEIEIDDKKAGIKDESPVLSNKV